MSDLGMLGAVLWYALPGAVSCLVKGFPMTLLTGISAAIGRTEGTRRNVPSERNDDHRREVEWREALTQGKERTQGCQVLELCAPPVAPNVARVILP